MKTAIGFAALLAASALVSPASAQMGSNGGSYDDYTGGVHNGGTYDPRQHKTRLTNDAEGIAEDQRMKGHCDIAIPTFRRLAALGEGYEGAEYNLGLCLLDIAKVEHDAQQTADQQEGIKHLVGAANAGFGKAQIRVIALYLDGKDVPVDPVEAQKWALIYHDNGTRLALGLPDIPPELRTRLDTALIGTMRADARKRADAWAPVTVASDQ
jgi:TPR repeat protein